MKKISDSARQKLAQRFFELVWNEIEENGDSIYESLDPDYEYGDELCKLFNNDTVLKVLRIGFRQMYGTDLKCGQLSSERKLAEIPKEVEVPEPLEPCPKCGGGVHFVHPAFDGGSYVSCSKCHYSPQAETWAETDVGASIRWNNLCEKWVIA